MIDDDGTARLIDFGLSTIKPEFDGNSFNSSTVGGAIRWLAPELLAGFGRTRVLSRPSDIYSLGSVILQVSLTFHKQAHTLMHISSGTFRESSISLLDNRPSCFRAWQWSSTPAPTRVFGDRCPLEVDQPMLEERTRRQAIYSRY